MKNNRTWKIAFCGIMIAASFILANVKIMWSISFDSLPAFLCGLLIGPAGGAATGLVAHLMSALTAGFPLSLPVHIIISFMMAVTVAAFTITFKWFQKKYNMQWIAYIVSAIAGVCLNGPLSVLMLKGLLLPVMGEKGLISLMVLLSAASFANIFFAFVIYAILKKGLKLNGKHENL